MMLLPDNLDIAHHRCSVHESKLEGARSLVLDNGIFSLSLLPEYGGRLCSLYYRPLNLELLATEITAHPTRGGLIVRGGWCAAFPALVPEGEIISHLAWDAEIVEQSEARVAVRQWCLIDRIVHRLGGETRTTPATVLVERFVRLEAGQSSLVVEDVLTNRNIWPLPVTWAAVVSLRAQAGDRAVLPVDTVEVQSGVGPSGNELDFGLMLTTPYQAMARELRAGWLAFRPAAAPVDIRLQFPVDLLPHAVISAHRDEKRPAANAFRFQPLPTDGPIADDARGGALALPPKQAVHLPISLEVGAALITAGEWSRPGLQLAELITDQQVPPGRLACWRIGRTAVLVKTCRHLLLLMPEFEEGSVLAPEDVPAVDLILCAEAPPEALLRQLAQRTPARFVGPPALRQALQAQGVAEERSVALSPGARFDLPGLGVLAMPARLEEDGERLGFLVQADNLTCYHAGVTGFLGEFGVIGQQFHPQLVLLPLGTQITLSDALHAAKLLKPRAIIPLGDETRDTAFIMRCREQHAPFAAYALSPADGKLFDGYRLSPLA